MDTIIVFTRKSVDHIFDLGGTASWVLDRGKARRCDYVVCARNRFDANSEGHEEHASAFLVGKISDIHPYGDGRFLIRFDEYAEVDIPNVWKGWRNPVKYVDSSEIDIDFDALDWKLMPAREIAPIAKSVPGVEGEGLTIAQAKAELAATFGVSPEAVEITIRG